MNILYNKKVGRKSNATFYDSKRYIYFVCPKSKSLRIVADKDVGKKIDSCSYCKGCELDYITNNYCNTDGLYNFDDIHIDKNKKENILSERTIKQQKLKKLIENEIPKNEKMLIDDEFFDVYVKNKEICDDRAKFIGMLKRHYKNKKNIEIISKRRVGTSIIVHY